MAMFGAIGLGLVWGWVAMRIAYRRGWRAGALALLGTVALGVVALRLSTIQLTAVLAIASITGALICGTWMRGLERRYAREARGMGL